MIHQIAPLIERKRLIFWRIRRRKEPEGTDKRAIYRSETPDQMSIGCSRISLSVIQSTNFLMRSFYLKRSRPNLGYVINCSIVRVNRIFRYYRRYEQKFCARERRYSMRMRLLFLRSRPLTCSHGASQRKKAVFPVFPSKISSKQR